MHAGGRRYGHLPPGRGCQWRDPEDWTARADHLVTCPACIWIRDKPKADRRRRGAARARELRRPPRPPFEAQPGVCNLCGEVLEGRRRTWCSDACVTVWFIATSQTHARYQLVELHGRRCWSCGEPAGRLEVDHRRPLWSLDPIERLDLRWWLPFNLELLCVPCHRAKTAAEAGMRAQGRWSDPGPPDVRPLPLPLDGLSSA